MLANTVYSGAAALSPVRPGTNHRDWASERPLQRAILARTARHSGYRRIGLAHLRYGKKGLSSADRRRDSGPLRRAFQPLMMTPRFPLCASGTSPKARSGAKPMRILKCPLERVMSWGLLFVMLSAMGVLSTRNAVRAGRTSASDITADPRVRQALAKLAGEEADSVTEEQIRITQKYPRRRFVSLCAELILPNSSPMRALKGAHGSSWQRYRRAHRQRKGQSSSWLRLISIPSSRRAPTCTCAATGSKLHEGRASPDNGTGSGHAAPPLRASCAKPNSKRAAPFSSLPM